MSEAKKGLLMLFILTIITGVIYPLIITGINQLLFPNQSNGSTIEIEGRVIGSKLIAQKFDNPKYFMPRSSAIAYDASISGATNFAQSSQDLAKEIEQNINLFKKRFGFNKNKVIPMDIATSSASGLDPEISFESAYLQAKTVAITRGIEEEDVIQLVREFSTNGYFSPARVNVLMLNIELDKRFSGSK